MKQPSTLALKLIQRYRQIILLYLFSCKYTNGKTVEHLYFNSLLCGNCYMILDEQLLPATSSVQMLGDYPGLPAIDNSNSRLVMENVALQELLA